MSKRIYVGNLPWNVTKARLEELFSSFGEMEDALVIANKYTGRSRGFGFVTFKKDSDADKAIREINKKEIEGRSLVVKEAVPLGEKEEEQDKREMEEGAEEMEEIEEGEENRPGVADLEEEEMPEEKPKEKPKKRGRKKKE